MALSYEEFVGDGVITNFSFQFDYLHKDHVSVYEDGVENTTFTWFADKTIQISPAPANGVVIRIQRTTPNQNPYVDFVDGSVLREYDLDASALQIMFIAQEMYDRATDSITLDVNNQFDALNKRIVNLADPINPQDAVTMDWAQTSMTSELAQAIAARDAAQTAQTGAETAESNAATSEANALQYANDASVAAAEAAVALSIAMGG